MKNKLIRLSKSCIGPAEKEAVLRVLDDEHLGMGSYVQLFESKLETYFSRPVSCVSTGTAAIQLALEALGIGMGDEVLVPSLTYVATFQAISATGAQPVPCDVDPSNLLVNLNDAKFKITNKTKAIVPMFYGGNADIAMEVLDFANKFSLRIVEDAAHAFGSRCSGRLIGSFGDISCFSFDGIKNITSGEGGCVVSDDPKVIDYVNDARLLGVKRDTEKRYLGTRSWEFDVQNQGWRYHMSNIMAAIGIVQLARSGELSSSRQGIAKKYDDALRGEKAVTIFKKNYDEIVPHIYPILLNGKFDRRAIQEKLLEAGVQTGVHYQPNHTLSYYKSNYPLPVTELLYPKLLTLPLHPELDDGDIYYVVDQLKKILG
ncbi:DegT/DnrJ/EryC1/StrS family aminotransferase [Polynucleobacter paludilacus]|uniref:DegT/DnrJ/EryC1/StrS family aminotransferase n=1 Tax=Polynucleobacter paludilacus TaxID=1855895 RepID=UPI00210C77D1|nr:DegT/DnrJ/EryC1/StrS family aminotransferase [Polynucleobacter paludilacus]QWD87857.1 DegT/DnrJ/EryC1/StrS family aminotransferase [Polynucleobacter paludilacus]